MNVSSESVTVTLGTRRVEFRLSGDKSCWLTEVRIAEETLSFLVEGNIHEPKVRYLQEMEYVIANWPRFKCMVNKCLNSLFNEDTRASLSLGSIDLHGNASPDLMVTFCYFTKQNCLEPLMIHANDTKVLHLVYAYLTYDTAEPDKEVLTGICNELRQNRSNHRGCNFCSDEWKTGF
jgi:hypothetical protein